MTPQEYIAMRGADGIGTTQAVAELVEITAAGNASTVWGWLNGSRKPKPVICRLLDAWTLLTPTQRGQLLNRT